MIRQFKTIADAVPHTFRYAGTHGGEGNVEVVKENGERMRIDTPVFTAAETAQLMRVYGHAWFIYQMCERNLYRDGSRADYWYRKLRDKAWMRIAEIMAKMAEWEKGIV